MNYREIDINNIPDPGIRDILVSLDTAFKEFGVELYLIGARARDFWFSAKDIPYKRFTQDIDFTVLIDNIEKYEKLRDHLHNTGSFIISNSFPQRVFSSDRKFMIDILPFGKIEKSYYVIFKDKDKTRISVQGMKEVYEKAVKFRISGGHEIKISSIPGLVILKLLAWNDKPDERQKDLKDIAVIMDNYFGLNDDMIYEKYNELFSRDLEIDEIAIIALGKEMKEIISNSEKLKNVVIEMLEKQLQLKEKSRMTEIIAMEIDIESEKIIRYLEFILKEIKQID